MDNATRGLVKQTVSGLNLIKRAIIILVLSLCGVLASIWLGQIWVANVLSNITFTEYYGLNTLIMSTWLPTFGIFFFFGVLLKIILEDSNKYIWPFSLGALASLIWLGLRKTHFIEEPGIADILWLYSELLMPIVGCVVGWWLYKAANVSNHPTS